MTQAPMVRALPPADRPIGLSAIILFLALGTVVGVITEISGRMEMLDAIEHAHPALRALHYSVLALSLGSLSGLWRWRRWAVWMTIALAAVRIPTEWFLGLPIGHVARVPIVLVILMALIWQHRARFV